MLNIKKIQNHTCNMMLILLKIRRVTAKPLKEKSQNVNRDVTCFP